MSSGYNILGRDASTDTASPRPYSFEYECNLLGGLMLSDENAAGLPSDFSEDHLFDPLNARIFKTIKRLLDEGHSTGALNIAIRFADDQELARRGGRKYLIDMVSGSMTTSPRLIKECAVELMELHERRALMDAATNIIHAASDRTADYRLSLAEIENELARAATVGRSDGTWIGKAAASVANEIVDRWRAGETRLGIPMGLRPVDELLGGLRPTHFVVLAGRPSMGKTTAGLNAAINVATSGVGVAFISLEMSEEQVAERAIAQMSASGDVMRLSYSQLTRPDSFGEDEIESVTKSALALHKVPLVIASARVRSVGAIASEVRRARREMAARGADLGLIVVDYLQLLDPDGASRSRVEAVSGMSAGLKNLAKATNLPVLALAQLSRAVEQREDRRPMLSDLRESGSIEQDADAIIFMFREEYYVERMEPRIGTPEHMDWSAKMSDCSNVVEFIIAKNRHAKIGTCEMLCHLGSNTFHEKNY